MPIRAATPDDFPALADLWERSVRATHDFLTEDDIVFFRTVVEGAALAQCTCYLAEQEDRITGFIGVDDAHIDMLFVNPDDFRRGTGRALLEHAMGLNTLLPYVPLSVDVNEQNHGARIFYERMGFVVKGRSAVDGFGKSFPILHLSYPQN